MKQTCKYCGNTLMPGSKFCDGCGAPVETPVQQQNPAQPVRQMQQRPPQRPMQQRPMPQRPMQSMPPQRQPYPQPPRNKGNNSVVIAIIICATVLLLAAGAFVALFVYPGILNKSPENQGATYSVIGATEQQTKKPKVKETQPATQKPKTKATQPATQKPKAKTTPKATQKPKTNTTPKATQKPKTNTTPKATQKPKTNTTPKATQKPKTNTTPKKKSTTSNSVGKPSISDFSSWLIPAMDGGVPGGSSILTKSSTINGTWKGIIYSTATGVSELNNTKIEAGDRAVTVTIKHYMVGLGGSDFQEDNTPDFTLEGAFDSGTVTAYSNSGKLEIDSFYEIGGKQFAIGSFTYPSGETAFVGLVRP